MTKQESMTKARAIRTLRAKNSIQSAINMLKLYDTKITVRAIANEAKISITTVQKYLKDFSI